MKTVHTGLDRMADSHKDIKGARLGLLANQASLSQGLETAKDVIIRLFPGQLKALFGPQHGYGGEDQDNMIETRHSKDPSSNIPVYSLYSETREPLTHMVEDIDALIIDLQDVGTRVYTFASTMLNCMRSMTKYKKKVVVLDRPNPLGGRIVEGNLLDPGLHSFVGPYKIPMRHGLTMGEMAQMFNKVFSLDCDLEVIPMGGWRRHMLWNETGLRWLMPSTNMPSFLTAAVYPGQVIWEGTMISEGRGTCRPFEIFGAPYLDTALILKRLAPEATRGCYLQQYSFRPTFNKHQGALCKGFMIHVLDPDSYHPYFTSLCILKTIMEIHPAQFKWKEPPYEYEYQKMPIDLILGDSALRQGLESGEEPSALREKWQAGLDAYVRWREPFLLYT
ncbi:conserved hypothetical protein [uncultured Desulfobacterium sp.]|uniref:DUF1343 domain-containing protein n=1 Tax=uncultured Desulfobacterium sp. TaxID=201089 RepID=A0A445MVN7_9BACT|nr:conserved hypothetical protein [uncultured Desulfobacterium sp.]